MIAASIAAVLLIAGVVLSRGGADQSPPRQVARPASSPTAGGSDDDSARTPQGFQRYQDRTGFSVLIPEGWSRPERKSTGVFFYSPDRDTYIQIAQSDDPRSDALEDWKRQERATKGGFRDYRRVRLERIEYKNSRTAADWEFTWTADSGRRHILDRGFVQGDRGYAILIAAPDADWGRTRARLQPVFDSFTAAPH